MWLTENAPPLVFVLVLVLLLRRAKKACENYEK